jgi:hypothetical protein
LEDEVEIEERKNSIIVDSKIDFVIKKPHEIGGFFCFFY